MKNHAHVKKLEHTSGFSLLGGVGGESLPHQPKICSSPSHLEKFPSTKFLSLPSPHQKLIPPTKQFSSYNPIKTAFLAVVIAPTLFLF